MIWADRAGLSLWAIGVVAVALALAAGLFGPIARPAPGEPDFVIHYGNHGVVTYQKVGDKPFKVASFFAIKTAARFTGFVALPVWLVLRAIYLF